MYREFTLLKIENVIIVFRTALPKTWYAPIRALHLSNKKLLDLSGQREIWLSSIRVRAFSALTLTGRTHYQKTSGPQGNYYHSAHSVRKRYSSQALVDGSNICNLALSSFQYPFPFIWGYIILTSCIFFACFNVLLGFFVNCFYSLLLYPCCMLL